MDCRSPSMTTNSTDNDSDADLEYEARQALLKRIISLAPSASSSHIRGIAEALRLGGVAKPGARRDFRAVRPQDRIASSDVSTVPHGVSVSPLR
jgi:hypothetical protein